MGLSTEDVKTYLRIDGEDEEDFLVLLLGAARKYVLAQIGGCNEEDERVRMLLLALVSDMYEKRSLTAAKGEGIRHIVNTVIMQLQFEGGKQHEGN